MPKSASSVRQCATVETLSRPAKMLKQFWGKRRIQPNLLIVGAQKCGTTWLHQALDKSDYFQGSRPKELNFWNRRKGANFDEYRSHFRRGKSVTCYWYESTPV